MSFLQYENCSFCGVSHLQGNRHAYTKKHRKIVQDTLNKFSKKIKSAASKLDTKPDVKLIFGKTAEESQKRFWCITCGGSFSLHLIKEECFIKNFGLIEHLIEDDHLKKLRTFWFIHRLKTTSDMSHYQIDANIYKRLLEKVSEAEAAFQANYTKELEEEVEHIKKTDKERETMLWKLKAQELRMKRNHYKDRMMKELKTQRPAPTLVVPPKDLPVKAPAIPLSFDKPEFGPCEEDFLRHKKRLEEKKRLSLTSKIRVDLSSKNSTTIRSKLWLPYKIRRSITRSLNVKGITGDVRNRYSCQSTLDNLETFEEGRSRNPDISVSHGVDDSINDLVSHPSYSVGTSIRPYISRRKISNQNSSQHPYNMEYFGQ